MNRRIPGLAIMLAGVAMSAAAAGVQQPIIELTPDCERALALSAGPAYMRAESGVYILGENGFEKDRAAGNGYYCMVVREKRGGLVPQCFDRASEHAHIKVHLDEAAKMRAGISLDRIAAERAAGFESGRYRPVDGHGVVYMASDYNFIMTSAGEKLLVAPHVMYHAPNMTNDDIGAVLPDALANGGMPFLNSEGPLNFMIGFVEKATDAADVKASCAGQLPDRAEWAAFPVR